ncbi:hypothetical protein CRG49_002135 [Neisseria sp. N95_16]|uniref:Uncharacterized protein n=1 Tax=Neisseria brasiliensis TaxID=2666100 RepID=A0A7X2GZ15_9NEIS|nr:MULTISPECIES: hypothetical protein [Neisseria]MRN38585.1 hypothetical protein [Neisseria brasiliensis]PJO10504.1 hypothetical protein CRG49_002135 [Neisseria sp. N95_16]
MAQIIFETLNDAYAVKDKFRVMGRDCYPMGVYEYIYDYLSESEEDYVNLDVIAWCCDLSWVTLDVDSESYDEDFQTKLHELGRETSIIHANEETGEIWFFSY